MYVADALLLTLFAGLWFASLGHGGWVLLFLMVGLLVEGPARFRDGSGIMDLSRKGILRLALGLVRIVAAGGILAWLHLADKAYRRAVRTQRSAEKPECIVPY